MTLIYSNSAKLLKESKTAEIFSLSKDLENKGKQIIHLEIGQPDIPVPKQILNSLKENLSANTGYTIGMGLLELREEITEYYERRFNISINSKEEIIIIPGGKFGIFSSLSALLNNNDEIVIATPSWPSYFDIANYFGSKVKELPLTFDIAIDRIMIEKTLTRKSKVLLINFPNNPTSIMVNKKYLDVLINIIREYPQLIIISDEIYLELTHNGSLYSLLEYPEIRDRLIIISGFSKAYSMTGFRLAYLVAPKNLINYVLKLITNTTTCVPAFIQLSAIEALRLDDHVEYIRKYYREKKDLILSVIKSNGKIDLPFIPNSSFYLFFEIKNGYENLALDLLLDTGVATIPGNVFGKKYSKFIRISYAQKDDLLVEGINKIQIFTDEKVN